MTDIHFDFMTPDVWDGLVIGIILIGLSLAILRLYQDRTRYLRRRDQARDSELPAHHEREHKL
jgi:hypothetical protein